MHCHILDQFGERASDVPGYVYTCDGWRGRKLVTMLLRTWELRPDIMHVHLAHGGSFFPWGWPLVHLTAATHTVITLHSGFLPSAYRTWPGHRRMAAKSILSASDRLICVSSEIEELALGELRIPKWKVRVIPAFIADTDAKYDSYAGISCNADAFCQRFPFVFLVSGSFTQVYGFHLALSALATLPEVCGAVFVAYGPSDPEYEASVREAIKLQPRALLLENLQHATFMQLMNTVSAYVRPTSADGDSVAVREALSLGQPVIASNCVKRPQSCALFYDGNWQSLATQMNEIVRARPGGQRCPPSQKCYGQEVLDLYREVRSTGRLARRRHIVV
jgi:glycosyltransferase involved in cell wall biosynthesis